MKKETRDKIKKIVDKGLKKIKPAVENVNTLIEKASKNKILGKKTQSKKILKKQQVSVDLNTIRARTAKVYQPYRSIQFKEEWEEDKRRLFFA